MTDSARTVFKIILLNAGLVIMQLTILGLHVYDGDGWVKILMSCAWSAINSVCLAISIVSYKRIVARERTRLFEILSTPSEELS